MRRPLRMLAMLTRVYLLLAALLLATAATSNLAWPPPQEASLARDRVVPSLTQSQMFRLATVLEAITASAVVLLHRRSPSLALAMVVWFFGALWLYRFGLTVAGPGDGGCGCFGVGGGILGRHAERAAPALAGGFLIAGMVLCGLWLVVRARHVNQARMS